jgi:RimJ/RimL family protein N-acetyltransferase
VAGRHYDLLYEWATARVLPWQWDGRPISPQSFGDTLWHNVLQQFVVEDVRSGRPIGLVAAKSANLHHRTVFIHVGFVHTVRRRGWPIESIVLLLALLFERYDMRKVYAEMADSSFRLMASGIGTYFDLEGSLRDHLLVDGEYQDLHILSITETRWRDSIRPIACSLTANVPAPEGTR